jgi:two-component system, NtrC family, response regulator AtoC
MRPHPTDIEEISSELFFLAASPAMRKLRTQAELMAKLDVPVLIVGENGSGKEIAAKLIHKLSARAQGTFLKVNCAALPGDVLEGELFGHECNTSAAASRTRHGKMDLCQNGTVMLDEITAMPAGLQAKLLRVLQHKEFFRLGGETAISTDARIVAAIHVDIKRALEQRNLREDLYYRLSAFTVQVPPLRERKGDISVLLSRFIEQIAKYYGLEARPLSPLLLTMCQSYSWPGNLRELENFAKRYLVMGDEFLEVGDLSARSKMPSGEQPFPVIREEPNVGNEKLEHSDSVGLKSLVRSVKGETERNVIASALEKTQWNRKAAARELGISYRGLLYKIQEYHLMPSSTCLASFFKDGNGKRSREAQ